MAGSPMHYILTVVLLIIGVIVAIFGYYSLTQATQGVGLIGLACFIGILARIAQSANHQGEIHDITEKQKSATLDRAAASFRQDAERWPGNRAEKP